MLKTTYTHQLYIGHLQNYFAFTVQNHVQEVQQESGVKWGPLQLQTLHFAVV